MAIAPDAVTRRSGLVAVAGVIAAAGLALGPPAAGAVGRAATVAYHGVTATRQTAARTHNTAIGYHGPLPSYRISQTGWQAGEPTIGVDRHGMAFVPAAAWQSVAGTPVDQPPVIHTPAGSADPRVRRVSFLSSADGGRHWQINQDSLLAGAGDSHPWFFDPYVYVDKATGRVFEGTLAGDAPGSYFEFSDNQGSSWTRASMYVPGINDRETVFAGPAPHTARLILTDPAFRRVVYYCVNQLTDAACARSLDGGRTFVPTASFAYTTTLISCEGLTGHGQVDAQGTVYLPYPCGAPMLAVSRDAGTTWTSVDVNAGGDLGVSARAGTTSMAVDAEGNLYYLWWDKKFFLPYLSISRDHAKTWSRPRMIAPPQVSEVNFPTIDVGLPGHIAIQFVGATDPNQGHPDRPWNHYSVLSTDALSGNPTFLATVTNPGGAVDPVHRGNCQGPCAGMLDYLSEPVIAGDGSVWEAAVDTCTASAGCASTSGTGAEATQAQGFVVTQVAGPRLRTTLPIKQKGSPRAAGPAATAAGVLATTGAPVGLAGLGFVLLILGLAHKRFGNVPCRDSGRSGAETAEDEESPLELHQRRCL